MQDRKTIAILELDQAIENERPVAKLIFTTTRLTFSRSLLLSVYPFVSIFPQTGILAKQDISYRKIERLGARERKKAKERERERERERGKRNQDAG